jgi:hypothetical protein
MNKLFALLTGILVISAVLAAARYSISGPSQNSASVRSRFLGTWKLVSTEDKLKDGTVRPHQGFGPHGTGYLMYEPDGHMCAVMTNPDRPRWDAPPTAAQKVAAMDGLAAYCGRFEIDEPNHVIWHYPDVAWMPNFVGVKQSRAYRFEGNRLIFSSQATREDKPDVVRWSVVWEKVR